MALGAGPLGGCRPVLAEDGWRQRCRSGAALL